MPQYAVLQSHPPDNGPMANERVRKHALAVMPQFEDEAKAKGVQVLLNIHLDPAHKAMMLFEAPNAEVVRDLPYEGGFVQFTDMESYLVTPVPDWSHAPTSFRPSSE